MNSQHLDHTHNIDMTAVWAWMGLSQSQWQAPLMPPHHISINVILIASHLSFQQMSKLEWTWISDAMKFAGRIVQYTYMHDYCIIKKLALILGNEWWWPWVIFEVQHQCQWLCYSRPVTPAKYWLINRQQNSPMQEIIGGYVQVGYFCTMSIFPGPMWD